MIIRKAFGPLAMLAVGLLLVSPADAKSSRSSTHSSSHSVSRASHTGGSHVRSGKSASTAKATRFIRRSCKTASCKAKHPSGEYMIPIKPKKTG